MVKILNLHHTDGVLPEGAVRIDRQTRWGNPFPMRSQSDAERERVIKAYREDLWARIQRGEIELQDLADLAGKDLACWCAPKGCHGHVLAKAARWAKDQLVMNPPAQVEIFVFGSNLAGRHGKGAAKEARRTWGAISGVGEGLQGRAYGIPTKDASLAVLPLDLIRESVDRFKRFAGEHSEMVFTVTEVGCGLAGYSPEEIAPMFGGSPANCILPESFLAILAVRNPGIAHLG